MELYDKTMSLLEKRRDKIINGGVNCIPSPFPRFQDDFCGIEHEMYYCVTSFTKGGKTQVTSFMFVYKAILYAYFSKNLDVKIIYFALEETKERVVLRFMSWLLYQFTKGKIRVCPKELKSTTKPVAKEVLERLCQFDIQDIVNFFEEHVIFPTEAPNPTGIYKYCKQYAEDRGTVHKKTVKMKDEFGVLKDTEVFDYYEKDNPDEYRLIVIDTINLIDTERGMTLKQSMDKLSEYCAKYLRNRYKYSIVSIQQQAFEAEGNEAFKLGKIRPSVAGLGDSKYPSRDANVVLGLFSPFRFGITEYFNYDITILKDHIRFLEIIVNRDGEMGGLIPLWFDGAVCDFKEMPRPEDKVAMSKVYNYAKQLHMPQQPAKPTTTLFLTDMRKRIYHFINKTLKFSDTYE